MYVSGWNLAVVAIGNCKNLQNDEQRFLFNAFQVTLYKECTLICPIF